MGLFDDDDFELDELLDAVPKYPSCVRELNEDNVNSLFNACLATKYTATKTKSVLFHTTLGYKLEEGILVTFDKDILQKNAKAIEYLYGQLKDVHTKKNVTQSTASTIEDFYFTYKEASWSNNKSTLLEFLYLGCNGETLIIKPFHKKYNGTFISPWIKPTLSPKDPNFNQWWEEHKAEWE